jgi:hypothetical protein
MSSRDTDRAGMRSKIEKVLNTILLLKESKSDAIGAHNHLLQEAVKRDAALDGLRDEIEEVPSTIARQRAANKPIFQRSLQL